MPSNDVLNITVRLKQPWLFLASMSARVQIIFTALTEWLISRGVRLDDTIPAQRPRTVRAWEPISEEEALYWETQDLGDR